MAAKRIALLVVDLQEDFCPPTGSLAVAGGRDIVPTINALLAAPGFTLRLATKDHHPPDHISFAANHPGAAPFTSTATVVNPLNPAEHYETRLWPVHCVQGTPGNALLPELAAHRVDRVVLKGTDARVEMYSAFRSPLRDPPLPSAVSELADVLREREVTDVVVCGLAGDYCVKCSAVDSTEEGWRTYVVEDAVRSVGGEAGWREAKEEMVAKGVQIVDAAWVKENLLSSTS